jgi:hypothetical protein
LGEASATRKSEDKEDGDGVDCSFQDGSVLPRL